MAWIKPRIMVATASFGCHLNGMVLMPLAFRTATKAVNNIKRKVIIPPYLIKGFPKTRWNAKLLTMGYFDLIIIERLLCPSWKDGCRRNS